MDGWEVAVFKFEREGVRLIGRTGDPELVGTVRAHLRRQAEPKDRERSEAPLSLVRPGGQGSGDRSADETHGRPGGAPPTPGA